MASGSKRRATRPGGFIQKHREILESAAYRDLRCPARCLLEEFERVCTPSRNGFLSIGTARAAELLNVTEPTASKAFYELESHGFIKLTKGHLWQRRKAREWRLTFEKFNGRQPTDEWRDWQPDKSDDRKSRPKKHGYDDSKNRGTLPKKRGQTNGGGVVSDLVAYV